MAERQSLRSKAASAAESLAGTVSDTASAAKERVSDARGASSARQELEEYRSDEVKDQAEARRQRAAQEAQMEGQQEARQEVEQELREREKEQIREQEREELRQQYGLGEDSDDGGADEGLANKIATALTPEDPTVIVGVDADDDGQLDSDEVSVATPTMAAQPPAMPDDEEDGGVRRPRIGPPMPDEDDDESPRRAHIGPPMPESDGDDEPRRARIGPPMGGPRDADDADGREPYDPEEKLGELFGGGPGM